MKKYDYLIIGSGLFGCTFAHLAKKRGKNCLVIDKRNHAGGNMFCENIEGINVHKYGPHIFHTSNKIVWDFVHSFVDFNRFTNSPLVNYKGNLYSLPFNMNTFYQLWGVRTPKEAREKIAEQRKKYAVAEPRNLAEHAISLVGIDIYEKLIKGYTEKQWGRKATALPTFIIKRLPVRFVFDNNYYNATYQGIPIGGYNKLIDGLLNGINMEINTDFFAHRKELSKVARNIVFTGKIDEFYNYQYGQLEYRSLRFEHQLLNTDNYQGNAVVNYSENDIPFTRIIEHKHFEFGTQPKSVITHEYPEDYLKTGAHDPYYPINNPKNMAIYEKYAALAKRESNVIFGGRLAEYKYYDMDQIIESVFKIFNETTL